MSACIQVRADTSVYTLPPLLLLFLPARRAQVAPPSVRGAKPRARAGAHVDRAAAAGFSGRQGGAARRRPSLADCAIAAECRRRAGGPPPPTRPPLVGSGGAKTRSRRRGVTRLYEWRRRRRCRRRRRNAQTGGEQQFTGFAFQLPWRRRRVLASDHFGGAAADCLNVARRRIANQRNATCRSSRRRRPTASANGNQMQWGNNFATRIGSHQRAHAHCNGRSLCWLQPFWRVFE